MTKLSTPPEVEIRARGLMPCPFVWCEGDGPKVWDGLQSSRGSPVEFAVGCSSCDVFTPQCKTADEAIRLWNTRSALTPQDDVVEKAAKAIADEFAERIDIAEQLTALEAELLARAALEAIRVGGGM